METEEFENVKVVYVPSIDTFGIVGLDGQKQMVVYSIRYDFSNGYSLVVNRIISDETIPREEVADHNKFHLISKILNGKFSSCIVRRFKTFKTNSEEYEEKLPKTFVKMYLHTVNKIINKDNNKSMKTKEIFIPYYLEYVGTYSTNWLGGFEGLLFKKVDGSYVFVYKIDNSRSIRCIELEDDGEFTNPTNNDSLVREVGKVIMSGDFSELEFKLFDGFDAESRSINKTEKDQYLLTILNCLDINFSHKSMITDGVLVDWKSLKEIDKVRKSKLNESELCNPIASDGGIFSVSRIALYGDSGLSEKIYEHFKNYSMKEKINVGKLNCVRDIEDGINFVKLDVEDPEYDGDFDLVGLKYEENEEYTLVIREVSKSDLDTCKYRTLSYIEKDEFVWNIIDQDTDITEVLIQGTNKRGVWEEIRTNDVDSYLSNYIDKIFESGSNGGDCTLENVKGSKEFVDLIIDQLTELKGKLYRVEDKIDFDNSRPIMYNLMSTNKYLDNLNSKN